MAYAEILNGQKLGFKAGTQNSLKEYLKGGSKAGELVEGIFYLTTDTNRLYIGRKDSSDQKVYPVPVNQGILSVTDFSALESIAGQPGEFYYLEKDNILCIRSGDEWVQINADTTLASNTQNTTVTKTDGNVTVTSTVSDTIGNSSVGHFSFVKGDNITLDSNGNQITIAAKDTTHTLSASTGATIVLSNDLDPSDINTIAFEAAATTNGSKYGSLSSETSGSNIKYTLDVLRQAPTGVALTSEESGFKISITNPIDESIDDTIDPIISYGASPTQAKFEKGTATLNVYTKDETDNAISNALTAADAMTFKGVLTEDNIPTEGTADAGDTYKVGEEGTYFSHPDCKIGDLLIAAKDNASYEAKADWYYVPSGDDQTIASNVSGGNTPSISISDQTGDLGKMTLSAGTDIVVNGTTQTTEDGKTPSAVLVEISHTPYSSVSNTASGNTQEVRSAAGHSEDSETFTAITEIENNNGHVTGIKTSAITIHDTHNQITSVNEKAEDIKNDSQKIIGISIAPEITTLDAEDIAVTKLDIKTDTLELKTVDANEVTINLVWGTF